MVLRVNREAGRPDQVAASERFYPGGGGSYGDLFR